MMKRLYSSLLLIFLMLGASAQYIPNYKNEGDKAFNSKAYYQAAWLYQKALRAVKKTKSEEYTAICYNIAESSRLYENYQEGQKWYEKVIGQGDNTRYPLLRLWYGVCLRANQHFDEAIGQLQTFINEYKTNDSFKTLAQKELLNCQFAREQYQYPSFTVVTKMDSPWNAGAGDYALVKQQDNYWFTSTRLTPDGKNGNKLYVASAKNIPQPVAFKNEVAKSGLEYGTPAIDTAGKRMYFTKWLRAGEKTSRAIYYSQLKENEWTTPVKVNSFVNQEGFNAIQPAINQNGKQLFFASDKPGGLGGYDIWRSDLDDTGQPVNAVNLGTTINTPFDEQAPNYIEQNKRLVYSSKGFTGLGGFDFFESFNNGEKWSAPVNLGYPVNSSKDDLYYYPNGADANKFYFSSDRESDCCLNLFEAAYKNKIITGLVVDCDLQKGLQDVKVSLIDSATKQIIAQTNIDAGSKYVFTVSNTRANNIIVEKTGYFTKTVAVHVADLHADTLANPTICMQVIEIAKTFVLKNIEYDFDKATLRPESEKELDHLVAVLNDNPKINIELSAHTDSIGSEQYNQRLSQQRAQSCVDYIIAKGIQKDRIVPKGYGKTRPIAPNSLPDGQDNPEGRQLNRRTEFMVISN